MAIGYPKPGKTGKLLDTVYDITGNLLFVTMLDNKITGIIGIDTSKSPHGWLIHLAVHPENRRHSIGRSLINDVMDLLSLTGVTLETGRDAVGFYFACGFTAAEIPGALPGRQRYRCTKGQPPKSVLEYYNK